MKIARSNNNSKKPTLKSTSLKEADKAKILLLKKKSLKKGETPEFDVTKVQTSVKFWAGKSESLGKNSREIFLESSKYCKGQDLNDIKQLEFYFKKFRNNSGFQSIFALISILSSILWYEVATENKNETSALAILWITFISSFALWILIVIDHFIRAFILYEFKQIQSNFWENDPESLFYLFLRLACFFLHPNPVFHNYKIILYSTKYPSANAEVHLNAIFAIVCLFRMYFFFKYFLLSSKYHSARTQRICEINDFDTNLFFALKCTMLEMPYTLYMISFCLILFVCGFSLRVTEAGLKNASGADFGYLNSIWFVFITMTTVGYGDFYPSSDFGRFIGILSCFIGIFLISMVLVAFGNILILNTDEFNIYTMINKIETNSDKEDMAKKVTMQYLKLCLDIKNRKCRMDDEKVKMKRDKLLLNLFKFKEKTKLTEMEEPKISEEEKVFKKCEHLEKSIEQIGLQAAQLNNLAARLSNRIILGK